MCQCPISGALHFYRRFSWHCADQISCVNALSRAHFISTRDEVESIVGYLNVSMPYLGRTSFLHRPDWGKGRIPFMCQCPISGALHFYGNPSASETEVIEAVSMPYLGRTSFLRWKDKLRELSLRMCQCPISGALHFYVNVLSVYGYRLPVSMPYLGRTSFLLALKSASKIQTNMVSMPYLGRTSFLLHWFS